MTSARRRSVISRRGVLGGFAAAVSLAACGMASAGAIRCLTLVRLATGEVGRNVPFWQNGAPDQHGLAELNWLMRDVEGGQVQPIDLQVYYLLAILQAEVGRPIGVTSGYRTKTTNDRLRQHGIDAARNSFHLRGRAADVKIQGLSPARIAVLGSLLGLGGVGLYRNFVHLDTGPRRFWTG